jgi:excisionase family DNA binding protein
MTTDLITVAEAARRLDLAESSVRRLIQEGVIPVTEYSPRVRLIDAKDIVNLPLRKPGPKKKSHR